MKRIISTYNHLSIAASLIALVIILSSCSNKQDGKTEEESTSTTNLPKKEYSQFIFETTNLYRYEFPTHINDIIVDRAVSQNSEVFMVIVEDGKSVHHHQHADTEQIFYMLEGTGILSIGKDKAEYAVKPGDVVRIPPSVLHSIRTDPGENIKYLCVDCFGKQKPLEPTWDEHVRVVCKEQGYDYNEVVKSNENK
ncbi:MAG: cupin domain-containing protein [Tenuifilaceae bacterium]